LSNSTVSVAEIAGNRISNLIPDIEKTAQLVQEISVASREQDAGSEEINRTLQQLDGVVQRSAASTEELASSAAALSGQAERQRDAMCFFTLTDKPQTEVFDTQSKSFSPQEDENSTVLETQTDTTFIEDDHVDDQQQYVRY